MNTNSFLNKGSILAAALALTMSAHAALTDLSTLPLSTYYAPSSVDVKPNILFVLDDSGSMDWDAMPDQATWFEDYNSEYRPGNYANVDNYMPPYMRYNSAFNGIAYNPAIRYLPPIKYNADGSLNTTTYPSMTGTSTATGGVNWVAVKNDGYGVQSTNTSDLSGGVLRFCHRSRRVVRQAGPENMQHHSTPSHHSTRRQCAGARPPPWTRHGWAAAPPGIRRGSIRGCRPRASRRLRFPGPARPWSAGSPSAACRSCPLRQTRRRQTVHVGDRIRDAINACSNAKPSGSNCTTVGYSATGNGRPSPFTRLGRPPQHQWQPKAGTTLATAHSPKATFPCRTGVIRV